MADVAIKSISRGGRAVDVSSGLFRRAPVELARAGHDCGIDKEFSRHIVVMYDQRSFDPSDRNLLLPDALEKRVFIPPEVSRVEAAKLREKRFRDDAIGAQRKPSLTLGDRLGPKIDLPDDGSKTRAIAVDSRCPCNGRVRMRLEVCRDRGAAIGQKLGVPLDEEKHIALRSPLARDVKMNLARGAVGVGLDRDDFIASPQQLQQLLVIVGRNTDDGDDFVLRAIDGLGERGFKCLPVGASPIEHGNDDRNEHDGDGSIGHDSLWRPCRPA